MPKEFDELTADRPDRDVLIAVNEKIGSKCFMYMYKEERPKAVVPADGYGNKFAR